MSAREPLTTEQSALAGDNLRLVAHILNKIRQETKAHISSDYWGTYEDELLQEGNEALCRTAQSFDDGRGFTFSAYAGKAIRNAMWRFIGATQNGMVGIPYYKILRDDKPIHLYENVDYLEELAGESEETMLGEIDATEVLRALHKLCAPYSTILLGIYHQGETFRSIGRSMDMAATKVKRMHDEALRFIRLEMGA